MTHLFGKTPMTGNSINELNFPALVSTCQGTYTLTSFQHWSWVTQNRINKMQALMCLNEYFSCKKFGYSKTKIDLCAHIISLLYSQ